MRNTLIIIASILVITGLGAWLWYGSGPNQNTSEVPIQDEFPNRVVYTTDLGVDTEPLIQDCQDRGGEFSDCGSVCPDRAEVCAQVCAYTCEL